MLSYLRPIGLVLVLLALSTKDAGAQRAPDTPLAAADFGSGYAGVYPHVLSGRITASGARYDPDRLVASHRTLPIGSFVRVVNVANGRSVEVHIIDRGPFSGDRIMDLSERAARDIGLRGSDEAIVRVVPAGSPRGSGTDGRASVRVAEYGAKTWTGSVGFTVQLGSFSTRDAAESVGTKVTGSWILEVKLDGQTYYRLNFGRYASREDAARDIAKLEAEGFFGFVKTVGEDTR